MMILLSLLIAVVHAPVPTTRTPVCSNTAVWRSLLVAHRARYQAMGMVDAVKLLQQATMGSEHWVTSMAEATRWMDQEWPTLGSGPVEPLVDTLGTPGHFARIHLRPYRARGGSPDVLVKAFVRTGRTIRGNRAALSCALAALASLARTHVVPWPPDSIAAVVADWSRRGYPALDHSPAFVQAYRPAYRVIALPLVPALLRTLRAHGHLSS